MGLNLSRIGPLKIELAAIECLKKPIDLYVMGKMVPPLFLNDVRIILMTLLASSHITGTGSFMGHGAKRKTQLEIRR